MASENAKYLYEDCGYLSEKPFLNIKGGYELTSQSYPWQVWIFDDETGESCGGSIITPSHILTAAQCVFNKESQYKF